MMNEQGKRPDDAGAKAAARTLDVSQIDLAELESGAFPPELDVELRVVVSAAAFNEIKVHASREPSVEVCGVLVGRLLKDSLGPFLLVEAALQGTAAREAGSHVTFTHETWDHIHREKDRTCPELAIIGWYHTHPGFGVFLSEMDQFIQDNFFNLPHQIALVYDPLAEQLGLFVWKQGGSARLTRYWLDGRLCHDKGEIPPVAEAAPQRRQEVPIPDYQVGTVGAAAAAGRQVLPGEVLPAGLLWVAVGGVLLVLMAFWLGGMVSRLGRDGQRQTDELVEGLIRSGLFRDGLSTELDRLEHRLQQVYTDLEAYETTQAHGELSGIVMVQQEIARVRRDLAEVAQKYTEAERLARRMKVVTTMSDEVDALQRDSQELKQLLALVLAMEAQLVSEDGQELTPEMRSQQAAQLRALALRLAPLALPLEPPRGSSKPQPTPRVTEGSR